MQRTYWNFAFVPDQYVGWYRPAVRAALDVARDWRPDVVLASGTPWTSLLVGRTVATRLGLPFVAELRDPWTGTTLSRTAHFGWRARLDARLERHALARASALISVSDPYAEELRDRYHVPSHVVLNGFDAQRYAGVPSERPDDGVLRLLYTGNLSYERDITPLLEAMASLGDDAARVRLDVIGNGDLPLQAHFAGVAERLGVGASVRWLPALPYHAMARTQRGADVLLLVTYDDPSQRGVYTGKLFEYVGARRPILLVGMVDGVAADLLRDRGLGAAESTADGIAARLRGWLAEKREGNGPADTAGTQVDDLTRESQTRRLEAILVEARASFGRRAPARA
ncbi:glycosyltransferase [Roseisolibacter sp. H3M3-2]|uniref:glycosyltransferase n=1 Tax=Roseisolibacter sp. H3M3-2 TaxID=3031323 RepID=UPI0023D9D498|nr:glycosyltransferase [Roseisolibacter sp. H3M3-2]MDF1502866.1 glycosyltransferase [Roseisolibacter sp. H3M3-2]